MESVKAQKELLIGQHARVRLKDGRIFDGLIVDETKSTLVLEVQENGGARGSRKRLLKSAVTIELSTGTLIHGHEIKQRLEERAKRR